MAEGVESIMVGVVESIVEFFFGGGGELWLFRGGEWFYCLIVLAVARDAAGRHSPAG